MEEKTVVAEVGGVRLDAFVSQNFGLSRSLAVTLIEDGNVLLNGKTAKKKAAVGMGDTVSVTMPDLMEPEAEPQDIPLHIVYEDAHLLVVNKPKGMVVHPAPGNPDGTLVNALLYHCKGQLSGINGVMRPGIVHRIDKDTSGLLMVAKTDKAHNFLAEQIKEHSFTREYEAIVYGNFKESSGTINFPIGRDPKNRQRMAVVFVNSKPAVTHYEVLERFEGFSHVRFRLETGRTHQIRVHSAYLGHPLAGDPLYGPKKIITELDGQCLNAGKIGFVHPESKEYMEFSVDLPEYFKRFKSKLKPI
ncbi:MAG: RluA family pseudouridine synthase [Ruminococcaceae bacterium]|nr:RluA family pseudouridine synthase [Oscillospiraceae bacterium]